MNEKYLVYLLYHPIGRDDVRLGDPDRIALGNAGAEKAESVEGSIQAASRISKLHSRNGGAVTAPYQNLPHEVTGEIEPPEKIGSHNRCFIATLAISAIAPDHQRHAVIDQRSSIRIPIRHEGGVG